MLLIWSSLGQFLSILEKWFFANAPTCKALMLSAANDILPRAESAMAPSAGAFLPQCWEFIHISVPQILFHS